MKARCVMVLLIVGIFFSSTVLAEEFIFSVNSGEFQKYKLIAEDQMKIGFSLMNDEGADSVIRGALVVVNKAISLHETGHALSAFYSGAQKTKVSVGFLKGYCSYKSSHITLEEEVRISVAGLDWNNVAAEEVIGRNLGKRMSMFELLWFGVNQWEFPRYVFTKSRSRKGDDINSWFQSLGITSSDVKLGALWQALGGVVPFYAGVKALRGDSVFVPQYWFNFQSDLTDAGIMYRVGIWHKQGQSILSVQAGWGKNRLEGGDMFLLEAKSIIDSDLGSLEMRLGYSKTRKMNWTAQLGFNKMLGDRVKLEVNVNHYSGYHRSNLSAHDMTEGSIFFSIL